MRGVDALAGLNEMLGSSQLNCGLRGFSAERLPNKPDQKEDREHIKG